MNVSISLAKTLAQQWLLARIHRYKLPSYVSHWTLGQRLFFSLLIRFFRLNRLYVDMWVCIVFWYIGITIWKWTRIKVIVDDTVYHIDQWASNFPLTFKKQETIRLRLFKAFRFNFRIWDAVIQSTSVYFSRRSGSKMILAESSTSRKGQCASFLRGVFRSDWRRLGLSGCIRREFRDRFSDYLNKCLCAPSVFTHIVRLAERVHVKK